MTERVVIVRYHAHDSVITYLLRIGFSRITPENRNGSGKFFYRHKAYVGRTQISRVKILAPLAKGAQNGGKRYMNSHFFVAGQIDMKFGQITSIGVLY